MQSHDVSNERLQRALRAGQTVVWEWDLATDNLAWSGNVLDLLGGTFKTQSGFEEHVHPDDQERRRAALQRTFSQGTPYDVEMRFIRPDGTVIWICDKAELFRGRDGQKILAGVAVDITTLKTAEADPQGKSSVLEATLENMDQGLLMFDASETIRVYNKRVLQILDLPAELLAGQPSFEAVRKHQLDNGEFVRSDENFRQWVSTRGFTETSDVYERVRPNGVVLEVRTIPLRDGGAVRTFTDITARKAAEAEAREKAALLEATLEHMDQGFFMYDRNGTIQVYNRRALEILDLPAKLLASRPSYEAVLKYQMEQGDFAQSRESFRGWVVSSGFRETSTYERVRPNGLVLEVRTIPLSDGGAVRTFTDITARRRAEVELKESEERYRTLVAASATIVWRAASDGSIIEGAGWNEYTGQCAEEYTGYGWFKTVHPDDHERAAAVWQAALASGRSFENEYRVRRMDGEYRWCLARGAPVKNQDGSIREWVGTLTDVHDPKLAGEQLRQVQKMEAVGQLTGGVAHDFNNLLTVILGYAEMLAGRLSDPSSHLMAQMIVESAERGAALTRHLLAFGRRQSLNPKPLKLDDVVQGMMPLLQRTLSEHIALKTELSCSLLSALADRALLESALLNLVVNARDAMPQGGCLTLTTGDGVAGPGDGQVPVGHPVVFVTVADTGTGMSPEVLEHAFEPFFTTKEVGQGSGLGLPMVYGFAEQSGGNVAIKTKEGQGTSVTIQLRAITNISAQPAPDAEESAPEMGTERILLVEDEPQVLQFVSAQLLSLGYEVTAVSSGLDALDWLRQSSGFDLLFTDVVLPNGISGVELSTLARHIRPDLKVLLTSGYSEDVFKQHGKPEEDIPLLRKPYRREELARILRKILDPNAV